MWLVFAPIKRTAVSFLTAKATEIGVSRLLPVVTAHTNTDRVNIRRLHANAIEAAEQSERLTVPEIAEPAKFQDFLRDWPRDRLLLVGDETGTGRPVAEVASELAGQRRPYAVMTGTGGRPLRRTNLTNSVNCPLFTFIGLGPRVLRADTAARWRPCPVVQSIAPGTGTSTRLKLSI